MHVSLRCLCHATQPSPGPGSLRAGEQRFARDGVTGARMSDVVRDAGQANDSAVGYHFGSRQGLLEAIVAKHVAAMDEPDGRCRRGSAGLPRPGRRDRRTDRRPARDRGRSGLPADHRAARRLVGVGSGHPAEPLRGTVIGTQLEALTRRLGERIGMPLARERVALMVTFLTGALAARARSVESGPAPADVARAVRRPPGRRADRRAHRAVQLDEPGQPSQRRDGRALGDLLGTAGEGEADELVAAAGVEVDARARSRRRSRRAGAGTRRGSRR